MTFVAPAFTGDEARVEVEGDATRSDHVELTLLRRDGRVIAAAHAGVDTANAPARPPWERSDLPSPTEQYGDPLPHEPVGTPYPDALETITRADVDHSIDGIDPTPWYRTDGPNGPDEPGSPESPWGGPIVPTVRPVSRVQCTWPTRRAATNITSRPIHTARGSCRLPRATCSLLSDGA